jgi:hypothetical protein
MSPRQTRRGLVRSARDTGPGLRARASALVAAVVAAIAATLMLVMSDVASAEFTPPWDHYLCYLASDTHGQPPPPVTLIDQFDEIERKPENVAPQPLDRLCNPVIEKNGKRTLIDPIIHLDRYPFKAQPKTKVVRVLNQFEEVNLTTTAAGELMVPSTKTTQVPPLPPPKGEEPSYEHYKCYTLANTKPHFKPMRVSVVDQFGRHTLKVTKRLWLCNPTNKFTATGQFPIKNPQRHLVCYLAKGPKERLQPVFTNNQFFPEELQVVRAAELCLPSLKTVIR